MSRNKGIKYSHRRREMRDYAINEKLIKIFVVYAETAWPSKFINNAGREEVMMKEHSSL